MPWSPEFTGALLGALGATAGVLATWVDPDEELDPVPQLLRQGVWWTSTIAWILLGFAWALVMNLDKVTSAFVAFQMGIVAPYAVQRLVALAKRAQPPAGSVD